jgi:nucleoside-diphosphate-sugar epimerase
MRPHENPGVRTADFICGYLVEELLQAGHEVVGIDNFSKYGRVQKSYDANPHYTFVEGDAKNVVLMKELIAGCDHFVAAAAMIGGISYFTNSRTICWLTTNAFQQRPLVRRSGPISSAGWKKSRCCRRA